MAFGTGCLDSGKCGMQHKLSTWATQCLKRNEYSDRYSKTYICYHCQSL